MKCSPEECTDGDLVALTRAGRQDAFAELMRRHKEPLYRLIRGHIGDPEEAVDLVQDSFISAFKALDRYDQTRPFRAWMARIAINKCRDWARRRAVRRLLLTAAPPAQAAEVPDPAPGIDDTVGDRQELERLWQAIADLPRALKEPLILRTIDGLSQAEVAALLRISGKAVETRLYRARRRLSALRDVDRELPR
ncbi:sigma-70 family RNA polymerase sigma factor [Altererythrobacter aerius]|jgi:RNA polymerase sigma factor CnrH|uniref:Sigma-70 family RNA polymerase sigma factor n=1 Tax=Tsuneonella aeria TaxID=1837929 RepID=A0A6I4TFN8_9SPHN|nr:RNA polymerase sigma factor [Tsuneonella aeria]MXO76122.1 sigma-70 family RNA polymerase sigma factor [Tsuneonella aeria]